MENYDHRLFNLAVDVWKLKMSDQRSLIEGLDKAGLEIWDSPDKEIPFDTENGKYYLLVWDEPEWLLDTSIATNEEKELVWLDEFMYELGEYAKLPKEEAEQDRKKDYEVTVELLFNGHRITQTRIVNASTPELAQELAKAKAYEDIKIKTGTPREKKGIII